MAIRINYNPMSVLTNNNLAKTDRLMSKILDRMSSGIRLQHSSDDPAAMVVANSVRYYRRGVERAGSNAEEAVSLLQTAEGGMDQVTAILQRMRTLALTASSSATVDKSQLAALQGDLDAAAKSITTIATSTSFGATNLLDGTLSDISLSADAKAKYRSLVADHTLLPGGIKAGSDLAIDPTDIALSRTFQIESFGAGAPGTTNVGGPGTMNLAGPKGMLNIPVSATMTIDGVVAAVNASTALTGIFAAYDPTVGELHLESTAYGSAPFSATSDIAGFLDDVPAVAPDATVSLEYTDAQGNTQTITLTEDPTSADGLTFRNLLGGPPEGALPPFTGYAPGAFALTVLDDSAGGPGTSIQPAGNTLHGTRVSNTAFQIGALASQRVAVEIPDMRAGALGASAGLAGAGFSSIADLVTSQALVNGNADSALKVIDAALDEVTQARGVSGALQGNTLERVQESLQISSINLRDYEGILRDVDMAKESSEYARVQVMLQAATAMLAQANQVPQSVLQLLK